MPPLRKRWDYRAVRLMRGLQLLESVSVLSTPTSEPGRALCYWQGRGAILKQARFCPVSDGLCDHTLVSRTSALSVWPEDSSGIPWDLVRAAESGAPADLWHHGLNSDKILRGSVCSVKLRGRCWAKSPRPTSRRLLLGG